MNGVILVAVISVGNSAVFGSSRTLAALADQGQAPRVLAYVDRARPPADRRPRRRPRRPPRLPAPTPASSPPCSTGSSPSRASAPSSPGRASASRTSGCARRGRTNHRSVRDMAFRAQAGVAGSWVGLAFNVLVLVTQVWVAIDPLEETAEDLRTWGDRAQNFFVQCAAIPVVLAFYLGHKLWFGTSVVRVEEMDVDTGRRDFGRLGIIKAQEEEERNSWPRWKRVYRYMW